MNEKCIHCGKELPFDKAAPTIERSCYAPGLDQICLDCFCKANKIPVMHGLYFLNQKEGHQIQPTQCMQFSADEVDEIQKAAFTMDRLFQNLNRSIAAEKAFKEFKDEIQKPNSENPYDIAEVDRRFRAFIFEWKLFMEHWRNYIYNLDSAKHGMQYVKDYIKLYKDTKSEVYQEADFMVAHVIRNYISHANDAVDSSHIGGENKFWIHKASLLRFLDDSIAKERNSRTKSNLQSQKLFIVQCDEKIDLKTVTEKTMKCLERIQEPLMNYQIDRDIINSCKVLLDAKEKTDEMGIDADVWEIWKLASDKSWMGRKVDIVTLQAHMELLRYCVSIWAYQVELGWLYCNRVISCAFMEEVSRGDDEIMLCTTVARKYLQSLATDQRKIARMHSCQPVWGTHTMRRRGCKLPRGDARGRTATDKKER